ncbi:MAG TPA: copper transporter [Thermoleophilaceae bacterium]|nr:copper transporter [Thermoleophilaceae bacterium]
MVDFRYHALSLVAVFLALGIGIVLGVTVGDSLVSDADRTLRDSLREDVTEAREEVRDEQSVGSRREEVIDEATPLVAEGRLSGARVALVAVGELPGDIAEAVDEAVEMGDGGLVRTFVLAPPEFPDARGTRGYERAGRRFGALLERGDVSVRRLREEEPRRISGDLTGTADAVVVYRHPPGEPEDDEAARELELREAFETGLFEGLRENVVGVEALATEPSQIGWFEDQVVASVDNADVSAGRLALVLMLQEAALAQITGDRPEGSYGYKDTADAALPDLSE